jgi:hypothetical protein
VRNGGGKTVEIQLNNQNLDFTIEHNETLGEVVKDIETWLEGTDMVLYSVRHEERELLATPYEQWAGTPHSEVGTLDVTVKPTRELTLLNLQTILEYLEMLSRSIEQSLPERLEELLSGFSALVESLDKHFSASERLLPPFVGLFQNRNAAHILGWGEEERVRALRLIELVRTRVSFRLQELQDPNGALETLSDALSACTEEISEISVLLQTGKDRQAMDTIVRFSELSQNLVRLVSSISPGNENENLQGFYQDLNGVLSELLEAFETRDSVLIGDLMEYEVAPRLGRLRGILQELS